VAALMGFKANGNMVEKIVSLSSEERIYKSNRFG
jgi:hypothetical protein